MNSIIIYDSAFGNTKKIADSMSEGLPGRVKLAQVGEVNSESLKEFDLIIIGSPTQGGRPTAAVSKFVREIPQQFLKDVAVAAFDTRYTERTRNIGERLLMKVTGYAADKIAKGLIDKGGRLVEDPQGFIVDSKEGPLRSAELERAKLWAAELQKKTR